MIMILSLHSISGVVSNDSRVLHRILENQHKKEKGRVTAIYFMDYVACLLFARHSLSPSVSLCLCSCFMS